MPREFYKDTVTNNGSSNSELCLEEVAMWDGPAICMRSKGHEIDDSVEAFKDPNSQLHQEPIEGWVWNVRGIA